MCTTPPPPTTQPPTTATKTSTKKHRPSRPESPGSGGPHPPKTTRVRHRPLLLLSLCLLEIATATTATTATDANGGGGAAPFLRPRRQRRAAAFVVPRWTARSSSSFLGVQSTATTVDEPAIQHGNNRGGNQLCMRVSRGRSKASRFKGSEIALNDRQRRKTAGRPGQRRFVDPNKLFVGNLPYDVTSEDLTGWFDEQGVGVHVVSCKVIRDWKTKESKGYGFVMFMDPIYATSAMELIRGRKIKGRVVRLSQGQKKPADPVVIVKDVREEPMDNEDEVIAGAIGGVDDELETDQEEREADEEEVHAGAILEEFSDMNDEALFGDDDDDEEFEFDGVYEEEYLDDEGDDGDDAAMNRAQRREAAKLNKKRRKPGKGFGNVPAQ